MFKALLSLSGPLGSLGGAILDRIVDKLWVRIETKIDASQRFTTESNEIKSEAESLKAELRKAIGPEETDAVLDKIANFYGRIGKSR